jgi:hypothetical protein
MSKNMSAYNFGTPAVVKHLTSGNNFWAKLQPVLKNPGQGLTVQTQVNAGGGVRGQKTDFFVILNVSRVEGVHTALAQNGLQLVSSHLVQSVPVHESALKGVLAIATKGGRKIVDIGSGLALGQIDLMKSAFPQILSPDSPTFPISLDEDFTMPQEIIEMDWGKLPEYISALVADDINPFIRLQRIPYLPAAQRIGILVKNISNTNPVVRCEIVAANFASNQKKLAEKIGKLAAGEYIRVVLLPSKRDLFIGDLKSLSDLSGLTISQVESSEKEVVANVAPSLAELEPTTNNLSAIESPAFETGTEEVPPAIITQQTGIRTMRKRWTSIYMECGSFQKDLEEAPFADRYAFIEYKNSPHGQQKDLGIIIDYELCEKLGIQLNLNEIKKIQSSEISARNVEARESLERQQPFAITRYGKIQAIAFSAQSVPEPLKAHIENRPTIDLRTEDAKTESPKQSDASTTQAVISLPSKQNAPFNENGTVNISAELLSFEDKSIGWTDVRLYPGKVFDEVNSGAGFRALFYRSKPLGIIVSNKINAEIDDPSAKRVTYGSGEIRKQTDSILASLKTGEVISISRFSATQYTIYPATHIPQKLALNALGYEAFTRQSLDDVDSTDRNLSQELPPSTPATNGHEASAVLEKATGIELVPEFEVVAKTKISVPSDLPKRIVQRTGENESLTRLQEVRKNLTDPNVIVDVNWNGTALKLTTNPTLIDNLQDLAKYFNLQAKEVSSSNSPELDGSDWISTFYDAATFDGLVVFKPAKGENSVLMTRDPEFFANIAKEFC